MKQVLFLDDMVVVGAPVEHLVNDNVSVKTIFLPSPPNMSLEPPPQKNTFIHFDIPCSPSSRPPTPTASAPGILLRRLFKTKEIPSAALDGDIHLLASSRSHSSESTMDNDCSRSFEQESFASTSTQSSPPDDVLAPPDGFGLKVNCLATKMHNAGECTPCNYFWSKEDGCRIGAECSFCHVCPRGEIKKRKKDKLKQLRRAGLLRR